MCNNFYFNESKTVSLITSGLPITEPFKGFGSNFSSGFHVPVHVVIESDP